MPWSGLAVPGVQCHQLSSFSRLGSEGQCHGQFLSSSLSCAAGNQEPRLALIETSATGVAGHTPAFSLPIRLSEASLDWVETDARFSSAAGATAENPTPVLGRRMTRPRFAVRSTPRRCCRRQCRHPTAGGTGRRVELPPVGTAEGSIRKTSSSWRPGVGGLGRRRPRRILIFAGLLVPVYPCRLMAICPRAHRRGCAPSSPFRPARDAVLAADAAPAARAAICRRGALSAAASARGLQSLPARTVGQSFLNAFGNLQRPFFRCSILNRDCRVLVFEAVRDSRNGQSVSSGCRAGVFSNSLCSFLYSGFRPPIPGPSFRRGRDEQVVIQSEGVGGNPIAATGEGRLVLRRFCSWSLSQRPRRRSVSGFRQTRTGEQSSQRLVFDSSSDVHGSFTQDLGNAITRKFWRPRRYRR